MRQLTPDSTLATFMSRVD